MKLSSFGGISIHAYPDEHGHPHVHVKSAEDVVVLRIDDGDRIIGDLPSADLEMARRWLDLHREEVMRAWDMLQRGESPERIAPLRVKGRRVLRDLSRIKSRRSASEYPRLLHVEWIRGPRVRLFFRHGGTVRVREIDLPLDSSRASARRVHVVGGGTGLGVGRWERSAPRLFTMRTGRFVD